MKSIVFDIETNPQDEERLLILAPDFKPAANLKDPEKIAASIADKRARYIADAALDWKTAEIVLIGMGDGISFQSLCNENNEKRLLAEFLELAGDALADGCMVGGHNVKGFDLPMIVNRARVHGLKLPANLLSRWKGRVSWHENIFDTLEEFSFSDKSRYEGLGVDAIARALGLPGKLGHGSDFPALWKSNRDAAIAYNRRDVETEIEIAKVCGLL